jgi:hypothetical protein
MKQSTEQPDVTTALLCASALPVINAMTIELSKGAAKLGSSPAPIIAPYYNRLVEEVSTAATVAQQGLFFSPMLALFASISVLQNIPNALSQKEIEDTFLQVLIEFGEKKIQRIRMTTRAVIRMLRKMKWLYLVKDHHEHQMREYRFLSHPLSLKSDFEIQSLKYSLDLLARKVSRPFIVESPLDKHEFGAIIQQLDVEFVPSRHFMGEKHLAMGNNIENSSIFAPHIGSKTELFGIILPLLSSLFQVLRASALGIATYHFGSETLALVEGLHLTVTKSQHGEPRLALYLDLHSYNDFSAGVGFSDLAITGFRRDFHVGENKKSECVKIILSLPRFNQFDLVAYCDVVTMYIIERKEIEAAKKEKVRF